MFSKNNAQQTISAPTLYTITDDDGFEEYDPAAFESKASEQSPVGSTAISSDDQFVPGAWRSPRSSVRSTESSGHGITGQGRAAIPQFQKRPDSGQWEVYDPVAFETTSPEVPGAKETLSVRLASSKPPKTIHNIASHKVSPDRRSTKLGGAESAEVVGRTRSPRNDFVAYAERTLSIDESSSNTDSSPRKLADFTPAALQTPSRAPPHRLASLQFNNSDTAEPKSKNGQPIQGIRSNWPSEDSSMQQAEGQAGTGGWAAFDAAYKAKFGEAIPPSGTAAVARKLGSTQPLAVPHSKVGSPNPTVEALTATLAIHPSGNTTLSNRLASPQPSIISNLGNTSPPEADQPLKEWPFRDLRVGKSPAGDKADLNFRLPKVEPAPGALKEWPFKGFKMSDITDRDRSVFGHKKSGSGAGIGLQNPQLPKVDQSTIYAESTSVLFFSFASSPFLF